MPRDVAAEPGYWLPEKERSKGLADGPGVTVCREER